MPGHGQVSVKSRQAFSQVVQESARWLPGGKLKAMRILMVHPGPEFSVADVFNGWKKALEKQGHRVMVFNTNSRLGFYSGLRLPDYENWDGGSRDLPACDTCHQIPTKGVLDQEQVFQLALKGIFEDAYVFWPDVIFFVSGFFFNAPTLQVLKTRGHKIVMLHTESPYQDEEQMKRGQFADLNLLNDPTGIDQWRDLGPVVRYMPHAYDPDVHYPASSKSYEADFAFVGTGFKSRRDFFGKLDLTGINSTIGGPGWGDAWDEPENRHLLDILGHHPEQSVDNDETARIYRLARVGINLYRQEGEDGWAGEGWAMGPREVEMAASELFFLRDPRPEGDELFNGILPAFRSAEEASELIKYWVNHDEQRERLARIARETIADRTFDNHAGLFMEYAELANIC
jgi:spore maturation protein CgeB